MWWSVGYANARSERAGGTGSPGPEPKVDEHTRNSLVTTVWLIYGCLSPLSDWRLHLTATISSTSNYCTLLLMFDGRGTFAAASPSQMATRFQLLNVFEVLDGDNAMILVGISLDLPAALAKPSPRYRPRLTPDEFTLVTEETTYYVNTAEESLHVVIILLSIYSTKRTSEGPKDLQVSTSLPVF